MGKTPFFFLKDAAIKKIKIMQTYLWGGSICFYICHLKYGEVAQLVRASDS
jgi:hypothetical protein